MGEYIKREDVLNALCYICNYRKIKKIPIQTCLKNPCVDAKRIIKIPAAGVRENVCGKWIDGVVAFHITCSYCGVHVRLNREFIFEGQGSLNFCPNCGADMRVV